MRNTIVFAILLLQVAAMRLNIFHGPAKPNKSGPLLPPSESDASQECGNHADILLLVFIHGIMGKASYGKHLESSFNQVYAQQQQRFTADQRNNYCVFFMKSRSSPRVRTLLGIDVAAERLLDEIDQYFTNNIEPLLAQQSSQQSSHAESNQRTVYLSIVGESMGGLVGRFLLGLLENRQFRAQKSDIGAAYNYTPLTFMTVSTPHLGVRRTANKCLPRSWNCFGQLICCRSTRQLFSRDEEKLLVKLAESESSYINGLKRFPHLTLVGHRQDLTVSVGSALIAAEREFKEQNTRNIIRISIHPDRGEHYQRLADMIDSTFYEIQRSESIERQPTNNSPNDGPANDAVKSTAQSFATAPESQGMHHGPQIQFHGNTLLALQSLPWHRVLVDFGQTWWSTRPFIHHSILGRSAVPFSLLTGRGGKELTVKLAVMLIWDLINQPSNHESAPIL